MLDVFINGYNVTNPLEGKEPGLVNLLVDFFGKKYEHAIRTKYAMTTKIFLPKFLPDNNIVGTITMSYDLYIQDYEKKVFKSYNPQCDNIRKLSDISLSVLPSVQQQVEQGAVNERYIPCVLKLFELCNLSLKCAPIVGNDVNAWLKNDNNRQALINGILGVRQHITNEIENNINSLQANKRLALATIKPIFDNVLNIATKTKKGKLSAIQSYIIKKYLKDNILDQTSINALSKTWLKIFDKGYNEFRNSKSLPSLIEKEYLFLFEKLGFSYSDVQSAVEDPVLVATIFNKELVSQINELSYQCYKDQVLNNPVCMSAFAKVMNNGADSNIYHLLNPIYDFIYETDNTLAFNVIYVNRAEKMTANVCVLPTLEFLDDALIYHELTHALFGGSAQWNDEREVTYSGFRFMERLQNTHAFSPEDFAKQKVSPYPNTVKRMAYKSFNELFTQYITKCIVKYAERCKFSITPIPSHVSGYDDASWMFNDFFKKRRDFFVEYFLTNNHKELFAIIGEQNLQKLDDIAKTLLGTKNLSKVMQDAKNEIYNKTGRMYDFKQYQEFISKGIVWTKPTADLLNMYIKIVDIDRQITENRKARNSFRIQ